MTLKSTVGEVIEALASNRIGARQARDLLEPLLDRAENIERLAGKLFDELTKLPKSELESRHPYKPVEVRRWVQTVPRDSDAGERSSQHLISWIQANGGNAWSRSRSVESEIPAHVEVLNGDGSRFQMFPGDWVALHVMEGPCDQSSHVHRYRKFLVTKEKP